MLHSFGQYIQFIFLLLMLISPCCIFLVQYVQFGIQLSSDVSVSEVVSEDSERDRESSLLFFNKGLLPPACRAFDESPRPWGRRCFFECFMKRVERGFSSRFPPTSSQLPSPSPLFSYALSLLCSPLFRAWPLVLRCTT